MRKIFAIFAVVPIVLASCASRTEYTNEKSFSIAPVQTPVGPIGPLQGTITDRATEQTTTGPDYQQIQHVAEKLAPAASNLPGPLGVLGGLGASALASLTGYLALKSRRTGLALEQVAQGIDAAKNELPDEAVTLLKQQLAIAMDSKSKQIVRNIRA